MRKFTATLFLLATLTLAVTAVPAMAEEDMGQMNYQGGYGPYTYNLVQYPSHTTNFFFYPESYVEFDARNGKYWMLETSRYNISNVPTRAPEDAIWGLDFGRASHTEFDIKFYSPDGKLIGGFNDFDVNSPYSIPRDGEKYDHLKVRIESHSNQNIDGRFMLWEPVEAVVATPIDSCANRNRTENK